MVYPLYPLLGVQIYKCRTVRNLGVRTGIQIALVVAFHKYTVIFYDRIDITLASERCEVINIRLVKTSSKVFGRFFLKAFHGFLYGLAGFDFFQSGGGDCFGGDIRHSETFTDAVGDMEVTKVFDFRLGIVDRVCGVGAVFDADSSDAKNHHDRHEKPCYKDDPYLGGIVILLLIHLVHKF